jgi:hypothetical protein
MAGAVAAPAEPAAPPLDPLSNRLLWLAGLLSVLLIAVVANSFLHGNGGLNPIAQAAERTANLPGGRIAMEVSYSAPGLTTPIVGSGGGAFDARSGRSRVQLTIEVPGRGSETITSVGDTQTDYVRSPAISGELPPGRAWLGMQPLLGHSPETAFATSGGAKSTIEMLSAVGGDVQREDRQTVRGHMTTRYKATIDLSRMSAILKENGEDELAHEYEQLASKMPATVPVEAWIDAAGVARRIRIVQELPTGVDGVAVTADMRMEIYDFAPQPKIALPPRRAVFDVTPLLRAELGLLNGSKYSSLTRPSTAKPLDLAAFGQKVSGMCRAAHSRARAVRERVQPLLDRSQGAASKAEAQQYLSRWSAAYVPPLVHIGRKLLRRLSDVPAPAGYEPDWDAALHDLAVELERNEAEGVALDLGSADKAEAVHREAKAAEGSENAVLRRLGIGACIEEGSGDGPQAGQSGASIE